MDCADITALNDFCEEIVNNRPMPEPVKRGRCLYCDSPIDGSKIYCDLECREAYEIEQRIKIRKRK